MKNVEIFYQMYVSELLEQLRWIGIPDCEKYKELLESEDKEVIRLAIELMTIDEVDNTQIIRCRQRFLGEFGWGYDLNEWTIAYEPGYKKSTISCVV